MEFPWLTLYGPDQLVIHLDRNKVVADDPGADTPAMVYLGKHSATFWCAADTGELDLGDYHLTPRQYRWLQEQYDLVNDFLYPEEQLC